MIVIPGSYEAILRAPLPLSRHVDVRCDRFFLRCKVVILRNSDGLIQPPGQPASNMIYCLAVDQPNPFLEEGGGREGWPDDSGRRM